MYDWISNDPNLPSGWKYRYVKLKSGHSRLFFITPGGLKLTGEKQLLEFFKENNFTKDDISNAKSLFKKVVKKKWKKTYDWQLDETVPEGWKYRTVNAGHGRKNKVFQTEDGLTIYGRESAAEFMKERN